MRPDAPAAPGADPVAHPDTPVFELEDSGTDTAPRVPAWAKVVLSLAVPTTGAVGAAIHHVRSGGDWGGPALLGGLLWLQTNVGRLAILSIALSILTDVICLVRFRRSIAWRMPLQRPAGVVVWSWAGAASLSILCWLAMPGSIVIGTAVGWGAGRALCHVHDHYRGIESAVPTALHRWIWHGPIALLYALLHSPNAPEWVARNERMSRPARRWYVAGLAASLAVFSAPLWPTGALKQAERELVVGTENQAVDRPPELADLPPDGDHGCTHRAGTVFGVSYFDATRPSERDRIAAELDNLIALPGAGNVPCAVASEPLPNGWVGIELGPDDKGHRGALLGPPPDQWLPGAGLIVMPDLYYAYRSARAAGEIGDAVLVRGHGDVESIAFVVSGPSGDICVLGLGTLSRTFDDQQCSAILAAAVNAHAAVVGYDSAANTVRMLRTDDGTEVVAALVPTDRSPAELVGDYRRVAGRYSTQEAWFPEDPDS